ncbi:hypothetical protein [Streptomyces lydicamycinicus]|uniref:hypothetical protein n=1 Tax=Streptomyces lydicamycinicus TaxID=1546107 RepID=UPI003D8088B8
MERSFGWLVRNRRLARDYERLTALARRPITDVDRDEIQHHAAGSARVPYDGVELVAVIAANAVGAELSELEPGDVPGAGAYAQHYVLGELLLVGSFRSDRFRALLISRETGRAS